MKQSLVLCCLAAAVSLAASAGPVVGNGERIAFLGDSITQLGNEPKGWVNIVMEGLKDAGVSNLVKIAAGVSGNRSTQMLGRVDGVLAQKPDWILISCGVNDVWHREHIQANGQHTGVDLPDFKRNMSEIYDRCEKAGAKPVMLTATMIMENPDDRKNKWLVPYNDFVKAEAKRRGALCIDLNAAMHRALADALDVDRRPGNKMTWDGVHPSALGNLMLSGAILRGLGVGPEIAGTSAFDCPHLEAIVARLADGVKDGFLYPALSHSELGELKALAAERKQPEGEVVQSLCRAAIEKSRTTLCVPPSAAPVVPMPSAPERAPESVAVTNGTRIAFFGDYFTHLGTGPSGYVTQTMRGLAVSGVRGATWVDCFMRWESTDALLKRIAFRKLFETTKMDMIVSCVGAHDAHDANIPLETTLRNLTELYGMFAAQGAPVVLTTCYPFGRRSEKEAKVNDFIRAEAAKRGWRLADFDKAFGPEAGVRDLGDFDGHSRVAAALQATLGVTSEVADAVRREAARQPITLNGVVKLPAPEIERATDMFRRMGVEGIPARDLVVAELHGVPAGKWERKCVPVVDLAGEKARQTVVAEGTREVYQGHPTTVLTKDGKLICVWCLGHGGGCGPAAESTDGGRTWTRIDGRFPEVYAKTHRNCPTLQKCRTKAGGERLFVFSYKTGSSDRRSCGVMISDDGGTTWREGAVIKAYAAMPPTGFMQLRDGRLALFGQVPHVAEGFTDRPGQDQDVWMATSSDDGETWSAPRVVAAKPEKNLCEPCCLRSPDGRGLVLLMRENRHTGRSQMCFSNDEGATWTAPVDTPLMLSGDRHEGVLLPDGRYVIAFRDTAPKSTSWGQYTAWVGTWDDLVKGREGQYRIRLIEHRGIQCWPGAPMDSGYSGVELLADGTILCTTYARLFDDWRQSSVVSTRFRIAETDGMKGGFAPTAPNLPGDVGRTEPRTFAAKNGLRLPYRWSEPSRPRAEKDHTLVVYLHGPEDAGDDNLSQLAHLPQYLKNMALDGRPVYFIAPQLPKGERWSAKDAPTKPARAALRELVDETVRKFGLDPKRVTYMGPSVRLHP